MVPAHSYEIPRVSYYSGYYHVGSFFAYQTFTIYGLLFQVILLNLPNQLCSPNPKSITTSGLASSSFARHYSRNRFFFLFLVGTKMFQFPTFPSNVLLYSYADDWTFISNRVSPFRNLWINGYLLLPTAYRSLSRLSSALGAKSFTLCSQQLNLLASHKHRSTSLNFSQFLLDVPMYSLVKIASFALYNLLLLAIKIN